ncbi:MAG: iron ABC transporter permease [Hyphomicrobiales bacterium]|nr:iron ABC transporter permease [Hyphomicrobiales bacterium]
MSDIQHRVRVAAGRVRSSGNLGWSVAALVTAAVVGAPIVAVGVLATGSSGDTWPHLLSTVLPSATVRTIWLMLGVGTVTLVVGTGTAWLVTMYRFPGRGIFEWLLLVPLAMPTYIIAFCYLELLDYSGTVQTALRAAFGWRNAADYWFPDIRSLGGAIFVMSFVLYPYVYLAARASFVQQSVCVLEVSRTLGRTAWGAFREVAIPLARPALAAGVSLALMECLNDIGAVEFLGVHTLTVAVYTTWLERSSLPGAAQISCVMLVFVFALLWAERAARRQQQYHHTTNKYQHLPEQELSRGGKLLAALACALPVVVGFLLPVSVLVSSVWIDLADGLDAGFWRNAMHSFSLSVTAALTAVVLGVVLTYACRATRSKLVHGATRLVSIGYAVPGTVLAIGILVPLAGLDNSIDAMARALFGVSTGLIVSGTAFAIVLAYTVRYLAISVGSIDAGFKKTSRNLDDASRTLGAGLTQTLWRVHLPMLTPVLGAALLLVFVDSMKELPATLLLRPFNFDTLATSVYTLASLDLFEDAALPALAIVVIGLAPVILIHRAIAKGRPGID